MIDEDVIKGLKLTRIHTRTDRSYLKSAEEWHNTMASGTQLEPLNMKRPHERSFPSVCQDHYLKSKGKNKPLLLR